MAPSPGTQMSRYRLIERIGRGGMGEVFLAYDSHLDRRVALKLLPSHLTSDNVARERLRREALAAAALDHPFICKVFDAGEDAGTLFIAMEYVRGDTLFARMSSGRLPLADALRIAGEMAEALEEAHSANLIHRDLKPTNIMLTSQGRVKIMDFGLAKKAYANAPDETLTIRDPLTGEGTIVGTPDYMSPEQLTGAPLDGRSDLFAFGIILCELLIGKHPFQRGSAAKTMGAILRDPPDLAVTGGNELSPGLMVLVRRLLAKSPHERYPSAGALRVELTELMTSGTAEATTTPGLTLIGRDGERDQLLRHLDAAMAGRGSLVLIGGEPGIGKTHLTRVILAEATRRGCFGAAGHCYEMEGAPPYVPFIETLEYSARVSPRESFRHYLGESASEIAKLMPELRRIYPDLPSPVELPPEQQRRYLFNAYREFVERAAGLTPIVVALEDLHWADEATLLLLQHLAQSVSTLPVLMIGTYRDVDLDVNRPFASALENWIREKLATRIPLRRFGLPAVQLMLTALSGRKPPDSLATVVFDETEGNPFFVEEVFQHLNEEGKLFDQAGNWRTGLRAGELDVPQGVRLVIGRRLARLSQDTRRILTTAAVVGRFFDLRLLEALEPGHPDAALDAVEDAERAQLVETDRRGREVRYRFVHELVRQTLADALSLPRRQRLHARIADALERSYGNSQATAIAHHLYQAGAAADADKTIDYLLQAARLAGTGAAHEEALANTDKALSLIEGYQHPKFADLSFARAVSLRSLSRWLDAVEWYERASAAFIHDGNVPAAVEANFSLAYIHLWNADGDRGVAVVERTLDLIGTVPSPLLHRLVLLKAVGLSVKGDIDKTLAALSNAKEIEARLPGSLRDGLASMFEARVYFHIAKIAEADRYGREAISRFRATGDQWGEAEVMEPCLAALWLGRIDACATILSDAIPRAERVGHGCATWSYKHFRGQMLMARGDFDEAFRAVMDAHAFGELISVGWVYLDYLTLGTLAFYRGQTDEALRNFRHGHQIEPVSYQSGHFSGALFLALAAKGDPEAPDALAKARLDLPAAGRPLSTGSCGCLAFVLEGLAISGMLEEAAALQEQAEYVVANGPLCFYSHHLFRTSAGIAAAAASNWTRAEEHYRIAIQQADSAPYRCAQPVARYWYAEMLLRRGMVGDHKRALELFGEALQICNDVGMPWQAQRTKDRLHGAG
jgi:tetratricopeptide (TPR) repeat protein